MLNTVVRQVAFYQFETLLHDERRSGELVPDRIGELWLQVQTESLGPAFEFTPEYSVFWAYVPHFIHSPFYVYAYAFGDCLVNALYSVFQSGHPGFQAKYLEHAACRRDQAAQGAAGAVRAGCVGSGVLEEGSGCDRRVHRRAGASGVKTGKAAKATPPPLAGGGWGEGADPNTSLLAHARAMRHASTPAERRLWQGLRKHQIGGLKFRRQVPLGPIHR